ncbi:putative multidrug resistance ABC transporter ATP-binding/permease protein YheH [Metalysinibacillus saudimassiliensis]|uniref:Putative multidrug resistance ABC transporter ATP-binding/permease protein YheH n=1 Tax=Metalysinibacillus saudimassiliensis TaxID=1461583 RepID=A0A078M3A2_9BACL|nr:putative multidrug resistance ABC transporter ATP-binding/permease protein YheH [Metalysinibacillus saudimassiliensis]
MTTTQRLIKYALLYKNTLLLGIFLLLIAVAADVSGPFIAKKIIDEHIADATTIEARPLIMLLGLFFGLAIIAAIFRYFQALLLQKGANRIVQTIRNDVYEHVQTLPIRYFDNLPAGKVVSRITNDTETIRNLFVTVLANFAASGMTIIGIYIALFILDWRMAMIALLLIPILLVWIVLYRKIASKYNHIVRSKLSDMNARINEAIQGMTVIQAFGQEEKMLKEFEDSNEEHFRYQNKLLILDSATSHNLVDTLQSLTLMAFIIYFGNQALGAESAISVGLLYAFVDYITRIFSPVMGIVNQLPHLEKAKVSAERVFELLDETGEPVDDTKLPRYEGNVRFDHVWFAYNEPEYVLKDITFEAKKGETVALVGHTGSGKSSIMNVLFRFYDPTKGQITIDSKPITTSSRQAIRQHMGIVLQDPYLFTGTIASNISLNDPRITRDKIEAALTAVGGERIIQTLPKGLDEPVIEKGSTLSAGQRQLISFARALAFDPAILILDEATSNIDTETEQIIQHAMDVLKQGRTTFVIAHRLSTIKQADKILVLEAGEIVESGSHQALLALDGRYAEMYKLQAGEKHD